MLFAQRIKNLPLQGRGMGAFANCLTTRSWTPRMIAPSRQSPGHVILTAF